MKMKRFYSYSAYVLKPESRNKLKEIFIPKYDKFIGHHITEEFGIPPDSEVPDNMDCYVVGHIDSNDGLEALVVSVDGDINRDDGSIYHITWSLNPTKYSPKDSNDLLKNKKFTTLKDKIKLETEPKVLP